VTLSLGDSFLMPTPGHSFDHLWIVISDPKANGGCFVIVNLTTDVLRAGTECELNPGDHRFVSRKCYVNFADALEIDPAKAANIEALKGAKITPHDQLDDNLVQRIISAAKISKALSVKLKKYF
jgi:mRNA-degrading endonuclease toxin of MazEF toxin-antitoxin module